MQRRGLSIRGSGDAEGVVAAGRSRRSRDRKRTDLQNKANVIAVMCSSAAIIQLERTRVNGPISCRSPSLLPALCAGYHGDHSGRDLTAIRSIACAAVAIQLWRNDDVRAVTPLTRESEEGRESMPLHGFSDPVVNEHFFTNNEE